MLRKGDTIVATWVRVRPVSLAGFQNKEEGEAITVRGTVRHLRGDDPISPNEIRLYVDPEGETKEKLVRPEGCTCETGHVEVNPKYVTQIGD